MRGKVAIVDHCWQRVSAGHFWPTKQWPFMKSGAGNAMGTTYWIDCGQSKLKKCRASPVRVLAAKGVMSCARAGQARGAGHLRCLQWPERLQTRLQTQWPRAARLPWCPCSSTARLETHCRAWMVVLTKNGAITTTGGMIVILSVCLFFFLYNTDFRMMIDAIGK